MDTEKGILAWHFSNSSGTLGHRDGRKIVAGETLRANTSPPALCVQGMHGSKRLIDALKYAPGHLLWRVKIHGDVIEGNDKLCGEYRTALWCINAEEILFQFSRLVALRVKHLWNMPEVVEKYLVTGDTSLRPAARAEAWYAAGYAARSAEEYAALSAARSAEEYAARCAAYSAAEAAAESAARYAARCAAAVAEREQQNKILTQLVFKARKSLGSNGASNENS